MTIAALVSELQALGVEMVPDVAAIRLRAPRVEVAELPGEPREELARHKPMLLEVLPRLQGMYLHADPIPTARPRSEAPGGPGHCFSGNDALDHPTAYGLCVPCDLAAEIYFRSQPGQASDGPTVDAH